MPKTTTTKESPSIQRKQLPPKESPSKSPTRSAESGSRIIFSENGSKNMQFFKPDDEVDRPHTKLDIHVEESSSSSDKGRHHNETEIPPPPPKADNSDVNSKLDSILTMKIDEERRSDARASVEEAAKVKIASVKLFNQVQDFNSAIETKFLSVFDEVKDYIQKTFEDHRSLRKTNILLTQLLSVTQKDISESVRTPIENLHLASDHLEELVSQIEQIQHFPVTPTFKGAPGGGIVPPPPTFGTGFFRSGLFSGPFRPGPSGSGPSGTGPFGNDDEDDNNNDDDDNNNADGDANDEAGENDDGNDENNDDDKVSESESEEKNEDNNDQKPPSPVSPKKNSPPPTPPKQNSPPPTPPNHPKLNPFQSKYSPIKDSDPPQLKALKNAQYNELSTIFADQLDEALKAEEASKADHLNLSLPDDRAEWTLGATKDQELGIVYRSEDRSHKLFFRASQIRRASNSFLRNFIEAIQNSKKSDPEAKKEMVVQMECKKGVRHFWSYAWRQAIVERA
ncbi:hypothetical protein L1887_43121 [Cichorium endivia]|nr:hypothetical protein L1887_43121 [Cichorium endivia]